jgi:hypothetical protein
MRSGGIAHQADALRVKAEIGRLGAHELNRRFEVVDAARIGAGLAHQQDNRHDAARADCGTPCVCVSALQAVPMSRSHSEVAAVTVDGLARLVIDLDATSVEFRENGSKGGRVMTLTAEKR